MSACTSCGYDEAAPVVHAWHLWLSVEAKSQNRSGANKGSHGARRAYKAHAENIAQQVHVLARAMGVTAATRRRRVTLTRHWGKRQRAFDRGNLIGGMKPVLDAIRGSGLVVDDSPRWCEDHYQQHGPHAQPGIMITIEEMA